MQREVPPTGRKRARERLADLKRETLNAKRSPPVIEGESKGKASCPEMRASICKEKSPPVREEESKGKASCPEKRVSSCKEKSPCQGEREQGKC